MARLPRQLKEHLELAGVPTPLEQAAVPKEWFVPTDIALRRDRVCWRPTTPSPEFPGFTYAYAKRTPGPGLLEQFVALGDAPDEDILRRIIVGLGEASVESFEAAARKKARELGVQLKSYAIFELVAMDCRDAHRRQGAA